MKASANLEIEKKWSIESEPRTLSMQQLQHAREAALYILNTKTLEEAISIFTEGLQPVLSLGHKGMVVTELTDDEEELDPIASPTHLRASHLLVTTMKDIVTAPF